MKVDHGRIQIALASAMSERFNVPPNRSCPICFRLGSLLLSRDGSGLFECGDEPPRSFRDVDGCGARFHFEPATRFRAATLVRIRTRALKRLTMEECDRVRGGTA